MKTPCGLYCSFAILVLLSAVSCSDDADTGGGPEGGRAQGGDQSNGGGGNGGAPTGGEGTGSQNFGSESAGGTNETGGAGGLLATGGGGGATGGAPQGGGAQVGGSGGTGGDTSTGGASTGGSGSVGGSGQGGLGGAGGGGGVGGLGGEGGYGGDGGAGGDGGSGSGGCQNNAACDNGLFCDGIEACVLGVCVAGSNPCDDGVSCTVDACDELSLSCSNQPANASCNDGLQCNGVEYCDAVLDCQSGAPLSCNDNIACTADFCDITTDSCAHVEQDSACSDGLVCTGVESCDASVGCVPGTPITCNDGFGCTADACSEATGGCVYTPNNGICDDGNFCNGTETCSASGGCQPGQAPNCSDGVDCTIDSCSSVANACVHTTSNAACDDGVYCNGTETCNATQGCVTTGAVQCQSDGIGCTADACSEATGGCVYTPNNGICDDGNFCNGTETCSASGGCQSGQAPNCSDGVDCTIDSCSSIANACVHTTSNAACDDGVYCNGTETCNATQGCVTTGAVQCQSDGIGCTVEACSESAMGCTTTPNNTFCAPGEYCTPGVGCAQVPPCSTDAECSDGDLCNGIETCVGETPGVPLSGQCSYGTPVNCDDGVDCTLDTCNPSTGLCSYSENDNYCNDGLACNGVESCDVNLGCVDGQAIACSDNVACTDVQCVEPGVCQVIYNDAQCDDGDFCNGTEHCTNNGCAAGQALQCPSDGIGCTDEVCVPSLGCVQVPDDTACPCGQTCDPTQGGCGNFCQVADCQGHVYACGDCIDNDGDCVVDSHDESCLGACDNTEESLYGGIPGQNNSPCKSDCYFDQDTGAGNDDCYWSHKCDPLEVAPNYPPEGSQCAYNPQANIAGYSGSCNDAFNTQSTECHDYCGPLTPNGCDCFGCCVIPGAPTPVWLGSTINNDGSCTLDQVANPAKCHPCTQVAACLNTCGNCEICIGKPDLPPECLTQECENGAQPCGQPGQAECDAGYFCVTGCCQATPQ